MSLLDFSPPLEPLPVFTHPWARRIKHEYAEKAKYAHNSIHNPHYPKKDESKIEKELKNSSIADGDLVKFQVIGIRVSKEFIYCSRLVEGLYRYRCKKFAPPIIRAVTTIEWPKVLNDIKLQYGGIAFCVKTPCIILMNNDILGGIEELKEFIISKYSYNLSLDYYKESIKEFAKFVSSTTRAFVYMHFQIDGLHIGTMIFMLYTDIVPNTCENFMRLCTQGRGGYRGTPVHRIVKDCWIQCGGFALKDNGMTCENFIVPFDRRGVLGMANAERHVDCSTQFFIILQPAPWMRKNYVGFGQLVDGNSTLEQIENSPAYYESPKQDIKIYASGVLNLECHDVMINKHTREYINAHIENICEVGEIFFEEIWENVLDRIDILENNSSAEEGTTSSADRDTKRIVHKAKKNKSKRGSATDSGNSDENNDFDVESYHFEPEEYSYQHVTSTVTTDKLPEKEEKLHYMALTDVPYIGEADSTFDLKKFLKGDYCLESDLQPDAPRKVIRQYPPEVLEELMVKNEEEEEESESDLDLESDEEKELNDFFKDRADTVCFAGKEVSKIAKGCVNIFEGIQRLGLMSAKNVAKLKLSTVITDEELRKNRLKHADRITSKVRHISLTVPMDHIDKKVKRRQTGYVKNLDLDSLLNKLGLDEEEEEEENIDDYEPYITRKIRAKTAAAKANKKAADEEYRQLSFRRTSHDDDEEHRRRISVLRRLYEDVKLEEGEGPTLKEYRPILEAPSKHLLLTISANITADDFGRDDLLPYNKSEESMADHQLISHTTSRKIVETKISSDYFNTLEHHHHHHQQTSKGENSIRSAEYAKTRPAMSVTEYQNKNRKYQEVTGLGGGHPSVRLLGDRYSNDRRFSVKSDSNHGQDTKKPVSFLTLLTDSVISLLQRVFTTNR